MTMHRQTYTWAIARSEHKCTCMIYMHTDKCTYGEHLQLCKISSLTCTCVLKGDCGSTMVATSDCLKVFKYYVSKPAMEHVTATNSDCKIQTWYSQVFGTKYSNSSY